MPNPALGDWQPSDSGPWVTKWDDETELPHVMPDFGRKHELSHLCWCHPIVDTIQVAITHNVAQ